jgi:metal-responsive CopG/Arc/MetJ family transcriptional regulator
VGYTADVKITVSIPGDMLKKVDILAKRFKVSRGQLVLLALREFAGSLTEKDLVKALDATLTEDDRECLEFVRQAARETLKRAEW